MEKLRIGYITDKQTIDSESLKDFQFMENRRRLRQEQVKRLKKMILDGRHFDSPIIVNEKEGKRRIIDGQHRISAITEIINSNENFQIEVTVIKYKDLVADQEKDIFTRWNSGTRQTSEDFMSMYVDEIPLFKMFDRWNNENFPVEVTIYKGEEGSVQFRYLVEPYIFAKKKMLGNTLGPILFVEEAKKLNKPDYEWIKNFLEEFVENAGEFNKENIYSRIGGLSPLMFLYMNGNLKPNVFWKRFKEKVKNSKPIKEIVFIGGFAAKRKIKEMMAEKMGITHIEEKVIPKGPETIFTEERIEWLKKNYPRTTWDVEDLAQEFDEKFGTNIVIGTLRSVLTKNKIKKDPEFSKRGPPNSYTPKVIEFMNKCAEEGMSSREAKEEAQKEFGHMFTMGTWRQKASEKGIKFRLGLPRPKFSEKIEKIIKENEGLIAEEIRDKIIEKTGENISAGQINHYLGKTRHSNQHPFDQKKLEKIYKKDKTVERILEAEDIEKEEDQVLEEF